MSKTKQLHHKKTIKRNSNREYGAALKIKKCVKRFLNGSDILDDESAYNLFYRYTYHTKLLK